MKRCVVTLTLAWVVGLLPLVAHATTADCGGAADGTPCTAACITFGQCAGSQCVVQNLPGTQTPGYAPDGTSCSSGNRCTASDACSSGACVPGAAVRCVAPDSCNIASCDPAVGCVFTPSCFPDLLPPPPDLLAPPPDLLAPPPDFLPPAQDLSSQDLASQDLASQADLSSPSDLAQSRDLAQPHDLARGDLAPSQPPRTYDLATSPLPVDMSSPALPDAGAPADLGGPPVVLAHVRGDSVLGGCNMGASAPAEAVPLLVALCGSFIPRRRRRRP